MNQRINIAKLMMPIVSTVHICDDATVRQGMEIFQRYGYTAIPVVDHNGRYLGCVTEGDFWRHMCRIGSTDKKQQEHYRISEIYRPDFCEPLMIEADIQEAVSVALKQNFIPIVDGRGYLSGLLTRQALIRYLAELALVQIESTQIPQIQNSSSENGCRK